MDLSLIYDPQHKGYAKRDVAMAYFPQTVNEETARRTFLRWIRTSPGLLGRLEEAGYRMRSHYYTPRQVDILFEVFGKP